MMEAIRKLIAALTVAALLAARSTSAQEAVMEEIVVEAPFDVRLGLPRASDVQIMIERLTLRSENQRALELQLANQNPLSTLLDLTRYSPIPLGASESRVDTFLLQNYMRADLNPRKGSPLFAR